MLQSKTLLACFDKFNLSFALKLDINSSANITLFVINRELLQLNNVYLIFFI